MNTKIKGSMLGAVMKKTGNYELGTKVEEDDLKLIGIKGFETYWNALEQFLDKID